MSGIQYYKACRLDDVCRFYTEGLGCTVWLRHADCVTLRHGNFLFGLHEQQEADRQGMLSLFYETRAEVDAVHRRLGEAAVSKPVHNEKYRIYHCFARDPEGRLIELQSFEVRLGPHLMADELLTMRRSVRDYAPDQVPQELIDQLLELCRFSPTARNTQGYYFRFIIDPVTLAALASVRGGSTGPIGRAPLAVAIAADPAVSPRHVQDGCIAAYHLLLSARALGLGTCWIADMDRPEVKLLLEIPESHYIATVTPLGFPRLPWPEAPRRKVASAFLPK